jgi:hypothetical protein
MTPEPYVQVMLERMDSKTRRLGLAARGLYRTLFDLSVPGAGVIGPVSKTGLAEHVGVSRNTLDGHEAVLRKAGLVRSHFPRGHEGWLEIVGFDCLVHDTAYARKRKAKAIAKWKVLEARAEPARMPTLIRAEVARGSRGNERLLSISQYSPRDYATSTPRVSTDDPTSVVSFHERVSQRRSQRGRRNGSALNTETAQLATPEVPRGPLGSGDPRARGAEAPTDSPADICTQLWNGGTT